MHKFGQQNWAMKYWCNKSDSSTFKKWQFPPYFDSEKYLDLPEEFRKCLTMEFIPDGAVKFFIPSFLFSPSMIPLNGTNTFADINSW